LTDYLLGDKMTDIVESKTFEQRMKERIRDSIGDLISDEDLTKMVDRSLEEVFFKPRPNPKHTAYYNSGEPATMPPLLHELVKEVLEANVQAAVREYIGSNQEEVNATIQKVVQEGIGAAVLGAMNSMFSHQLMNLQNNISQQISNYR
jgi:predicted house-cleaning noncanonical NTP pyrophosphatase (MazG superfamily)